jgi:hypothetical protein
MRLWRSHVQSGLMTKSKQLLERIKSFSMKTYRITKQTQMKMLLTEKEVQEILNENIEGPNSKIVKVEEIEESTSVIKTVYEK